MKFDIALYDLEVEERLEYVKNVGLYKKLAKSEPVKAYGLGSGLRV